MSGGGVAVEDGDGAAVAVQYTWLSDLLGGRPALETGLDRVLDAVAAGLARPA